jgi:hypothetical protein
MRSDCLWPKAHCGCTKEMHSSNWDCNSRPHRSNLDHDEEPEYVIPDGFSEKRYYSDDVESRTPSPEPLSNDLDELGNGAESEQSEDDEDEDCNEIQDDE